MNKWIQYTTRRFSRDPKNKPCIRFQHENGAFHEYTLKTSRKPTIFTKNGGQYILKTEKYIHEEIERPGGNWRKVTSMKDRNVIIVQHSSSAPMRFEIEMDKFFIDAPFPFTQEVRLF